MKTKKFELVFKDHLNLNIELTKKTLLNYKIVLKILLNLFFFINIIFNIVSMYFLNLIVKIFI